MLLVLLPPLVAHATPIVFNFQGSGSGSLGGAPFTTAFSITATADTANRVATSGSGGIVYSIPNDSAMVTLNSIGTFQITTPTLTFANNTAWTVSIARGTYPNWDLFDVVSGSTAFRTWSMLTSLSPVVTTGKLQQWIPPQFPEVTTTGGVLIFSNQTVISASFAATLVPEPTTAMLLLLGMLGCGWRRR